MTQEALGFVAAVAGRSFDKRAAMVVGAPAEEPLV
jgi:hypothetical protein